MENSLIFKGKAKDIKAMERLLLAYAPTCNNLDESYCGLDGHTEIRSIKDYDNVLDIIITNGKYFNLSKFNLKQVIEIQKQKDIPKKIQTYSEKKKERQIKLVLKNKEENLSSLTSFINSFKELEELSESIEIFNYYNKECLKFHVNKKDTNIDYEPLRTSLRLTKETLHTCSGYGLESAIGHYTDDGSSILRHIVLFLPSMEEISFKDYNEYCYDFEKRYNEFRDYVYNLESIIKTIT